MDIETTKKTVKFAMKVQMETGKRQAVFLWGTHGIGKTQLMRQVAEEFSEEYYGGKKTVECVNMRLAVKPDAGDLVGLPYEMEVYPDPDAPGEDARYTRRELAELLQSRNDSRSVGDVVQECHEKYQHLVEMRTGFSAPRDIPLHGPAVLFLDEVNRATRAVLDATFTLLEDGRAGTHQLPIDVFVVCAGNPPTEEYMVQELDDAFMDRALHIMVTPTQAGWLQYAQQEGANETVMKAVAKNPEFLGNSVADTDIMSKVAPSARSMMRLSDLMNNGLQEEYGEDVATLKEVVGGLLGAGQAEVFHATTMDTQQPVPGEAVIEDWAKVAETVQGYAKQGDSRLDLLHLTNLSLVNTLRSQKVALTKEQAQNVGTYVLTVPAELGASVVKMMTQPQPTKDAKENLAKHVASVVNVEPGVLRLLEKLNDIE